MHLLGQMHERTAHVRAASAGNQHFRDLRVVAAITARDDRLALRDERRRDGVVAAPAPALQAATGLVAAARSTEHAQAPARAPVCHARD